MSKNTININLNNDSDISEYLRYTPEFRMKVAHTLHAFQGNVAKCAQHFNISITSVKRWCVEFEVMPKPNPRKQRRMISPEIKRQVGETWKTFPSKAACGRFYNISKCSAYAIIDDYEKVQKPQPQTDTQQTEKPNTDYKPVNPSLSSKSVIAKELLNILILDDFSKVKLKLKDLIDSLI